MRTAGNASVTLSLCSALLVIGACSGDSPPPDHQVDAPIARFEVEYLRGHLKLSGHVRSAEHERRLVELANKRFGAASRSITLETLEPVPAYWQDTTLRLVDALATTHSASAVLTEDALDLRGIALTAGSQSLAPLKKSLPESVHVEIDLIDWARDVDVADLCTRAMILHETGPVSFEESGTVFRSAALPELERVVALANTCRDSVVEITGHTDSSGDERWNRHLSLARALAVADFLEQRGILAERLKAAGAGSSLPIADNQTRYGRSLNRRIHIEFRAADGTPLEPRLPSPGQSD